MKNNLSRRRFIQRTIYSGAGLAAISRIPSFLNDENKGMRFGLVTYLWAQDWDLPTIIANCEKAGFHGVELRTQHAHKVETNLNAAQRADVKKTVCRQLRNMHRIWLKF